MVHNHNAAVTDRSEISILMRILVFRLGFLGDTLVSIPALRAIREHFGAAHIDYLSEAPATSTHVSPRDVLPARGLVDRFLTFSNGSTGMAGVSRISLFLKVIWGRYDILVYLAPSRRTAKQIRRDMLFFRCAGITRVLGVTQGAPEDFHEDCSKASEHETDYLLRHLAAQGIVQREGSKSQADLCLSAGEKAFAGSWIDAAGIPTDFRRRLFAVGPGSKMQAKKWPTERYEFVVSELIRKYDVWPIIFGGTEDVVLGQKLIAAWERGTLAAGSMGVRGAAAVLARCLVYLGNDTGTMHLAAAAGITCVALFSARDVRGRWEPYGAGHHVFRHRMPCEGCMLEICDRNNECLTKTETAEVLNVCGEIILSRANRTAP